MSVEFEPSIPVKHVNWTKNHIPGKTIPKFLGFLEKLFLNF